jgi:hypothetical protein
MRQELAEGLLAFSKTNERLLLAAATDIIRDAEFFLKGPANDEEGPILQGRIDLLWRDKSGWHVLGWDARPRSGGDPLRGREPEILAAAWSVRQQVGTWPRTIGLFEFSRRIVISVEPTEREALSVLGSLFASLRGETQK